MGKAVGTFIRKKREARGMSQGEVAHVLRLKTAQSISNIERGVSPLPKSKVRQFARVLKVPAAKIVEVAVAEVQAKYLRAAGLPARARRIG